MTGTLPLLLKFRVCAKLAVDSHASVVYWPSLAASTPANETSY